MKTTNKISNNRFLLVLFLLLISVNFNSCTDVLDKEPLNVLTSDKQYSTVAGYNTVLFLDFIGVCKNILQIWR